MKVGVLTFHGSSNPGAFWQAYATCQLLARMGHEPAVIDYYSPHRHHRSHWVSLRKPRSWRRPDLQTFVIGQRIMAAKSRRELPLGSPVLSTDDLRKEHFDAVLVGADVVWENPIDPVYLGRNISTDRLISYAVSAGGSVADDTDIPDLMRQPPLFSSFSVRDRNTQSLLQRIGWSDNATLLSDPTITLEIPAECEDRPTKDKYLLVYCSTRPPPEIIKGTKRYAKAKGLKIIAVFYPQRWVDKNVLFLTAFRWMSYIANAEAVITNTFHGALLSNLSNRPLAVVNLSEATLLKSIDQYQTLGIDKRIVGNAAELGKVLSTQWDREEIAKRQPLGIENKSFLEATLADEP